jgi:PAT family acetyl-CoA transporter-like MFS transporter 1
MDLYLLAFPLRALSGLVQLWMVYYGLPDATLAPLSTSSVPWSSAALIFLVSNVHGAITTLMFMSQISFFTRIASLSPASGGAVMTLLNTLANLGGMWPGPLALLLLDKLSAKACTVGTALQSESAELAASASSCSGAAGSVGCSARGGLCATVEDGFPLLVGLSTALCVVWWLCLRSTVQKLQNSPAQHWRPAAS